MQQQQQTRVVASDGSRTGLMPPMTAVPGSTLEAWRVGVEVGGGGSKACFGTRETGGGWSWLTYEEVGSRARAMAHGLPGAQGGEYELSTLQRVGVFSVPACGGGSAGDGAGRARSHGGSDSGGCDGGDVVVDAGQGGVEDGVRGHGGSRAGGTGSEEGLPVAAGVGDDGDGSAARHRPTRGDQ